VGAWRIVDDIDDPTDGATQMHRDLELLGAAALDGDSVLRLYTWAPAALSLGRFQPRDDVDIDACERLGVDLVRRPTGGRALLHGADLTYAVALPQPSGGAGTVDAVYTRIARALIAGLRHLDVDADVARHGAGIGPVCFTGQQGADLRVGARKLCGSAQLRRNGAVLQHGSVLLHRLAYDETDLLRDAPSRAQLRDATVTLEELDASFGARDAGDALIQGFRDAFGISFQASTDAAPVRSRS
jgi:lipoate-protein ligase A